MFLHMIFHKIPGNTIWIISDEVYCRMAFDQSVVPSFLDISEHEDRVLIVNSLSKSWSMTGSRLGCWCIRRPLSQRWR